MPVWVNTSIALAFAIVRLVQGHTAIHIYVPLCALPAAHWTWQSAYFMPENVHVHEPLLSKAVQAAMKMYKVH